MIPSYSLKPVNVVPYRSDATKLRNSRWDYAGLPGSAQSNHTDPWNQRLLPSCGPSLMVSEGQGVSPALLVLTLEEGGTSLWMWVATRSWKRWGKAFSPRASRRNGHLDVSQWDPCWTSDLLNYKTINLCCYKPPNLWLFVREVTERWCNLVIFTQSLTMRK